MGDQEELDPNHALTPGVPSRPDPGSPETRGGSRDPMPPREASGAAREHAVRPKHQERVKEAAKRLMTAHAEALKRLGE